jgi:hypothetical protein
MVKSAPVEMLRVLDPVIELDDDMIKSAPVEMAKFVLDPVIELDDDMTKSSSVKKLNPLAAIIEVLSIRRLRA